MENTLTKFNFNDEVLTADVPVVVDFWATWCGPCKMIAPVIEQLAEELEGKVKVGKVNVDEQMELAMEYKIEVIPTLIYFKDGKVVKKTTGVMTKDEIKAILATL